MTPTDTSKSDMLSIQLSQQPGQDGFVIDSVDIVQPNFRHRLSFSNGQSYEQVLSPKLANYVGELVASIDRDAMIFSEPDAVVDLPGLVLGRLRMLVHTAKDTARQVIIRFAYFIGGVQSAFQVETHFKLPTVNHREAIAVAALHDICIPVFDIVSSVVSGLFNDDTGPVATSGRLDRFAEVETDLLFYLELLKRYIKSTADPQELTMDKKVLRLSEYGRSEMVSSA